MSKYVVEIELPFVLSIAPFVTSGGKSYLRFCDGDYMGICDVGGTKDYLPNFLKAVSPIKHGADLLHGGNLENSGSLSVDIVDNGILELVEKSGYSLNSGILRFGKLDNLVSYVYQDYEQLYFGYVDGCEIKDGILTIKSSTVDKGLGLIPDNRSYGYVSKREIKKDENLSNKVIEFKTISGGVSEHPRIVTIYDVNCPTSPYDFHNGIRRNKLSSGNCYMGVGCANNPFPAKGAGGVPVKMPDNSNYTTYEGLFLKFVTGASGNTSREYQIDSIEFVAAPDVNGRYLLYFKFKEAVFDSIDISLSDRVKVYSNVAYYPISDENNIDLVSIKNDEKYYQIDKSATAYETINGQKYLKINSRSNIWAEVPVTIKAVNYNSYSTTGWTDTLGVQPVPFTISGVPYTAPFDYSKMLDNDMSSYCAFDTHSRHTEIYENMSWQIYSTLNIDLNPSLGDYLGKELYFGCLIDRPISDNHNLGFNLQSYYKNGEIFPCTNDGQISYESFYEVVSDPAENHSGFVNSAPIGTISFPVNSISNSFTPTETTVVTENEQGQYNSSYYTAIVNPGLFFKFDSTKMHKIELDELSFSDVDFFRFQIRVVGGHNPGDGDPSPTDNYHTFIYRIGIWAKVEISSPDIIYVDSTNVEPTTNRPEVMAKDLIEVSGNAVESGYGLDGADINRIANFYSSNRSDKVADAISKIVNPANLVIGQDKDGKYYVESMDMIRPTSADILDIPSGDIFRVVESLSDIDISEVINFPKIKFKTLDGVEESIEVINLDGAFPTSTQYTNDPSLIDPFFRMSKGFVDGFVWNHYYSLENLYDEFLQPLYNYCKASYTKNGVKNTGDITFDCLYLQSMWGPTAIRQFFNYLLTYTVRRKTITISLPQSYKDIKLGTSVSILDPRIFETSRIYGYVSNVQVNPIALPDSPAYCNVSLICDSYKVSDSLLFF